MFGFIKSRIRRANDRKLSKRLFIESIQESLVPKVHYFARWDDYNVGDRSVSPYLYLDQFLDHPVVARTIAIKQDFRCIRWELIGENDYAVIGGGGCLNLSDGCNESIRKISSAVKATYIAGAGFNRHYGKKALGNPFYFNDDGEFCPPVRGLKLVGCRDKYAPNYVPCFSCLSKYFDNKFNEKRKVGAVWHKSFIPKAGNDVGIPYILNDISSMEEMVRFIGESESLLVTSYHAAYWGLLLNKKVVVISPFSDKFAGLKETPAFAKDVDDGLKLLREIKTPDPLFLEDSRKRCRKFFNIVLDDIESTITFGSSPIC